MIIIKSPEQIAKDNHHQEERDKSLPESIQIARINGKLVRQEITQSEALQKIAIIRKRFDEIHNTPNN